MTDKDPVPALEDFIENFTAKQPADTQTPKRVGCIYLYRRYLAHCQNLGLPMACKAQFAGTVFNMRDCLPEPQPTGGGAVFTFFEGLMFTGPTRDLALTPEVLELIKEHSALDGDQQKQNGPGTRRAR